MGRGTGYSTTRKRFEHALDALYTGAWPARLAWRLGLQRTLETVRVDVDCAPWPVGCPALRIAFASDLHAGPTTDRRALRHMVDRIHEARPDLVLFGGDFVLLHHRYVDTLAPLLAEVRAPLGKFAVLGNHDLWADDRHIERALERSGIRVLTNSNAPLPAPFAHVSVVGLDDAWVGKPDAERAFDGAQHTRVLLMHAPSGLLHVENQRFDLALCGHTHGGQIALPGGIPVFAPGPLARAYNHGIFRLEQGTLVTSRGTGFGELPIRLFAPADIVVATLRGAT